MDPEPLYNLLQLPKEVALPVEEELPQGIFNKDLLSTLHLLVALARHFQPDLALPTNVQVEVIIIESTRSGLKSEKFMEQLTECSPDKEPPKDVFDELFKLAPEKVSAVKEVGESKAANGSCRTPVGSQEPSGGGGGSGSTPAVLWVLGAGCWGRVWSVWVGSCIFEPLNLRTLLSLGQAIVSFVNQKLERLGLSVQNLDTQFADGVILLLLIGQLEGFFLHLKEFYLTPSSPAEMLHNVTLALELLKEEGLLSHPISPEDIVNKDAKSTLRVLYGLFSKHKLKANADRAPRGTPN
uniref:Gamma-parvin isoform X3 n=1 Tax=Castor canadensis TaxID=51338 RepID=A0A8B7VGM7_CASCN|nr:gamma-parvin isoform X3 [Castor canadensis]